MKTAVFSLLLLLTINLGEGLKCNFCYSKGSDLCTATKVQTCPLTANACGAVIIQRPLSNESSYSFRQCMNMAVCQGFITTPGAIARCCDTDLCN